VVDELPEGPTVVVSTESENRGALEATRYIEAPSVGSALANEIVAPEDEKVP